MAHKMNLILIDMCKYVKAMNIYTHLRSSWFYLLLILILGNKACVIEI
jgi:hypothetical protein